MPDDRLKFLHLSDIHFKHKKKNFDLDFDLRNEIEKDISLVVQEIGNVDGILVTGDIAFSAKPEEYNLAKEWIESLCSRIGCDVSNVHLVPGNHDVERGQQRTMFQTLIERLHNLNKEDPQLVDDTFLEYLSDVDSSEILFRHLGNFNSFAVLFNCSTDPDRFFWETDYPLNDDSILKIRGLNTAVISSSKDDNGQFKLLLGSPQAAVTRYSGVTYLTLCHHPPSWLKDADTVEDYLNHRVHIQLFGHKHRQRLQQIENCLRISSGAAHPSRNEPTWEPRYNFITLRVNKEGDSRKLDINVWARLFDSETTKFKPVFDDRGNKYHSYLLELEQWENDNLSKEPSIQKLGKTQDNKMEQKATESNISKTAYEFFSLPLARLLEIAVKLDIIQEGDTKNATYKMKQIFLERILEKKLINDLSKELTTNK